jgi:hypothetical protein
LGRNKSNSGFTRKMDGEWEFKPQRHRVIEPPLPVPLLHPPSWHELRRDRMEEREKMLA